MVSCSARVRPRWCAAMCVQFRAATSSWPTPRRRYASRSAVCAVTTAATHAASSVVGRLFPRMAWLEVGGGGPDQGGDV